jgi:DNA (cytosine-5)-methyltransferase 1
MRFASLCSGIGGADLALQAHGHDLAWHAEIERAPIAIHAERFGEIPNAGDVKTTDWADMAPVDIISAGYPCQPFSQAGLRQGTDDDRHLWPHISRAIETLRPSYVFLENVRGHLSLGAAIVVHDLADLGYMSTWGVLGSHHVGGCHRRDRFWLLAADATNVGCERGGLARGRRAGSPHGDHQSLNLLPTPTARDHKGHNQRHDTSCLMGALEPLPTPTAGRGRNATSGRQEGAEFNTGTTLQGVAYAADFGRYQQAVDRWAGIFGPPPAPLDEKGRLNPPLVEWMMGFPAGWVTGLDLSRTAQLKALGNAQQPQVAATALGLLADRFDQMEMT